MTESSIQREIVTLKNPKQWDQLVSAFPNAHIFHSSSWAKTLQDAYGHSSALAVVEEDNSRLLIPYAVVSRPFFSAKTVSMPYSDFAGPICTSELNLSKIKQLPMLLSINRIELRTDFPLENTCLNSLFTSYRASLPCSFSDFTSQLPKKSVLYPVRKAVRDGYSIREGKQGDLHTFYELMSRTRKRHGLPTPPLRFYEALYENLVSKGLATFFFADNKDGNTVAASVFLFFNNHAYYKYNASTSLRQASNANHLLLWEGVKRSIEMGCDYIDLGRASNTNRGLIRFKEHWLGKPIPLHYLTVTPGEVTSPSTQSTGFLYSTLEKVIHATPCTVSQIIGKAIYRYFS